MKTVRMMYMALIYSIGVPLMLVLTVGFFVTLVIGNIFSDNKLSLKDAALAAIDGARVGHRCNMIWVKYGNDYTVDDLLKELGS